MNSKQPDSVATEPGQEALKMGLVEEHTIESAEEYFKRLDGATLDGDVMTLGMAGSAVAMTRLARDQYRAGVAESPPGSNNGVPFTRYVRWFGNLPPSPWCAFFVSWCLDQVTDRNRRMPWANPGYVPSVHQWAAGSGRLVSRPEHGDLFGIGGEHMGIVSASDERHKTIFSVEGNFSDRVACNTRKWSGLWFARI